MGTDKDKQADDWLAAELEDSFDEELELETDDSRLDYEIRRIKKLNREPTIDRALYFRELFRLQAELVKLQDWVMATGYKLVVLFEGRDAAGKGGVIKRITQRLNPRVCRVVALPAPTDREYPAALQKWIKHFVEKSQGRAFVLFTSYRSMRSWRRSIGSSPTRTSSTNLRMRRPRPSRIARSCS